MPYDFTFDQLLGSDRGGIYRSAWMSSAPTATSTGVSASNTPTLNVTPGGWPTTGKIRRYDVTLTNGDVDIFTFGIIRTYALTPATTTTYPATFTGPGTSTSAAFSFYNFGTWVPEYSSHRGTSVSTSQIDTITVPSMSGTTGWMIEFEVRRDTWSSAGGAVIGTTNGAPGTVAASSGLQVRLNSTYPHSAQVTPWADLGAVDGQWLKVRLSFDPVNRLRVWRWTGSTWEVARTFSVPLFTSTSTNWNWGNGAMYVGNGSNASNLPNGSLNGDVRYLRAYSGDTLAADTRYDLQPNSLAYTWTTPTGRTSMGTVDFNGAARMVGTVDPDTVTVRADLVTPRLTTDFRLLVIGGSNNAYINCKLKRVQLWMEGEPDTITRIRRGLGIIHS